MRPDRIDTTPTTRWEPTPETRTPEGVYRVAAEANDLVRPGRITEYTGVLAADPSFRAGVDAVYAAGHVDGTVAERGRVTRLIRRHANSAGLPLSTSNALSRIVDEIEGTDG